jgi:hypothetical protein
LRPLRSIPVGCLSRRQSRYSGVVSTSAEQRRRVGERRHRLAMLPPEESRDVARWLHEEVAPELANERQRELAAEAAARFERRSARGDAD